MPVAGNGKHWELCEFSWFVAWCNMGVGEKESTMAGFSQVASAGLEQIESAEGRGKEVDLGVFCSWVLLQDVWVRKVDE